MNNVVFRFFFWGGVKGEVGRTQLKETGVFLQQSDGYWQVFEASVEDLINT